MKKCKERKTKKLNIKTKELLLLPDQAPVVFW